MLRMTPLEKILVPYCDRARAFIGQWVADLEHRVRRSMTSSPLAPPIKHPPLRLLYFQELQRQG